MKEYSFEEAMEILGISKNTLIRRKEKLGLSKSQLSKIKEEDLERLRQVKRINAKEAKSNKEKNENVETKQKKSKKFKFTSEIMKINDSDPLELKRLKQDFNFNIEFIDFSQFQAREMMKQGNMPDKSLTDSIDKYKKQNINIMKRIHDIQDSESLIEKEIEEELAKFM